MKHGDPIYWNGHEGFVYEDPEIDITCCHAKPCGKVTVKVFPKGGGFTTAHVKPAAVKPRVPHAASPQASHLH